MNKLKRLIVKYFVFCTVGISIAESAMDSTFFDVLLPKWVDNKLLFAILTVSYFPVLFFIFFWGAYIFYGLTKKAIEAESKRQVQEQNLLYSCIAHDLKTPMTSVQGFARALKDGKIKPEEQAEILNIIYKKSHHMNELVETLFMYSKLGTENYKLNRQKTNLCVLVRDLVAMHYSEFEERDMELHIEIPEKSVSCQLDEKEFRRAVNNLIVNAYKHNPKGTVVMIKVQEEKESVFVTVADSGEQIPKELAETMFKPFVCGDDSRTSGKGNGLGLAISAAIVEKHGGKLYLKNSKDGYTKGFVIQMSVRKN